MILAAKDEPHVTGGIPTARNVDFKSFERIIIDAFPCGVTGELKNLDLPMDYVARLLKWDAYAAATGAVMPHFETTYLVEPVTHTIDSERVVELDLSEPPAVAKEEDFWLVAHSGDDDEVRHLTGYARELQSIEGTRRADRRWPRARFRSRRSSPAPDGSSSAAGFNIMLETEPWRHKHHVVPLPRRYDDQFTRAARRRKLVKTR